MTEGLTQMTSLKEWNARRSAVQKGRSSIFLGYAAGVGKTYSMLEEAHRKKAQGINVVVGYVASHGRKETEDLTRGSEDHPS